MKFSIKIQCNRFCLISLIDALRMRVFIALYRRVKIVICSIFHWKKTIAAFINTDFITFWCRLKSLVFRKTGPETNLDTWKLRLRRNAPIVLHTLEDRIRTERPRRKNCPRKRVFAGNDDVHLHFSFAFKPRTLWQCPNRPENVFGFRNRW